mgnify:CR=1 FL=1
MPEIGVKRVTDPAWGRRIEDLADQIRKGKFPSAETTARDLRLKRDALSDWPPADLSGIRLFTFDPGVDFQSDPKLGKWIDSLNRLMHKLVEGQFMEIARVTGIMKKYCALYTPRVVGKETSARDLPGLTCRLSARHR